MRVPKALWVFSILAGALAAFSAYAADGDTAASAPALSNLDTFSLTDEEIGTRCQNAIAQNLDMVETEDGRQVPRCVYTYETARAVVSAYHQSEADALKLVQGGQGHQCDDNANQATCLEAGRKLASDVTQAYTNMRDNADAGMSRLASAAGNAGGVNH